MARNKRIKDVLDTGPVEPILRGERVLDLNAAFPRFINHCECPIDHYLVGGFLVDRQWLAGIRFRETYELGTGIPRTTANYNSTGRVGNGAECETAARLDANKEIKSILTGIKDANGVTVKRAILPAYVAGIIESVCGLGQWAGKGNMGYLKFGLDLLADHWRVNATK